MNLNSLLSLLAEFYSQKGKNVFHSTIICSSITHKGAFSEAKILLMNAQEMGTEKWKS
jgi:hypothetical protein